ncbi:MULTISPECIES: MraY family glycosyltransferase [Methylobacterium]|uniref:Undecaprenyl-phosphate N-acetylglucosaminyl 1-phosphate transferase n=1 Tax=Methylobacterium thuringiense TaxID=1003091 RepID=A0ABQ4TFU9_9HYPH|nr:MULTISPECIES: glycosyltransferase family 4 protein [Methylobacterium]TXN23532.1 glycosyltransferase family 4 protein [Methylobacterium sp. WL9]GJE53637.1 putative undecaprenyl-phosphate N-acetylglucosaminyl 1-phosphate transferase [Methylobacterium thuringiense]
MSPSSVSLLPLLAVPLAAVTSAVLIVLLMPLLRRYALARPNARSSHAVPTPQGGGVAIIAATVVVGTALLIAETKALPSTEAVVLMLSVTALAIVGGRDDVRPLRVSIRLGLQVAAVAAVIIATGGRLFPAMPIVLERGIEVLAGLWFVNLVNFTDGLDWMTLAGMVPVTAVLVLLGYAGVLPVLPTLVAAALLGGFLGFAPFNRPVARLFMGDVGSLPVGLLIAWLLYRLALDGGFAAAILLPLYPVSDATLTLLWRLKRGEKVWQAHRKHFYQVATVNGFSVPEVVGSVFAVSVLLSMFAAASLLWPSWGITVAALAAGGGLVVTLLRRFNTPVAGSEADRNQRRASAS